jgi:hypothetical protein
MKNLAKKKVENILIVKKSMRFDRLAGLNRVLTDEGHHNLKIDHVYENCSKTLKNI